MSNNFVAFRCAAVLMTLAWALPAQAQSPSDQLTKGPVVSGTGQKRATSNPAPPGLPGAAIGRDRISPQERIATDMPPTDARFDSINRGDISSARDALNRGADFNARNVLGLTPLDESIDLSRNDITFLLLSLRGGQPTPELSAPTVPGKPGRPGVQETKKVAAAPVPKLVQQAPPRPVAQVQPQRGGAGGTPDPRNGFLGFGG